MADVSRPSAAHRRLAWLGALATLWGACGCTSAASLPPSEDETPASKPGPPEADAAEPSPDASAAARVTDAAAAPPRADAAAGPPAFCAPEQVRPSARDGITDFSQPVRTPVPPLPRPSGPVPTGTQTNESITSAALGKAVAYALYVPAQYASAAAGQVALMFMSPVYNPAFTRAVERRMASGQIPPMVVVYVELAGLTAATVRPYAAFLETELFPALRARLPKLATDGKMHGIGGQSTPGAQAFNLAWERPQFLGKVLGGSASFACFSSYLYPYAKRIDGSRAGALRVSLTVGECDIAGTAADLKPQCPACSPTSGGCVDASHCGRNWLDLDLETAQALIAKGYATRLLVIAGGRHTPATWFASLDDDLSWLWRPIVCP